MIGLLTFSAAGAAIYRWRGTAHPLKRFTPRPMMQAVFALPYAAATPTTWGLPDSYWVAGVVWVVTTYILCTGHGGFHDLGAWFKKRAAERLELLIRWLRNDLPRYWYDALGLAVTGIAVTIPAGIATGDPILAASGALKAPAYMIAAKLGWGTEGGEWLTGAFLWGALFIRVVGV